MKQLQRYSRQALATSRPSGQLNSPRPRYRPHTLSSADKTILTEFLCQLALAEPRPPLREQVMVCFLTTTTALLNIRLDFVNTKFPLKP